MRRVGEWEEMPNVYKGSFSIGTRSVDMHNRCRPSALLSYLQEAATSAAIALNVSREEMLAQHNSFWMLARIWFRLDRPLAWDDVLTVRTWHRGGMGVSMYRDFDLFVEGEPVGEAVSTWVLADQDSRRMLRLSQVPAFRQTSGGVLCKERLLQKIPLPPQMSLSEERTMRYSDVDINGHVNNARYADLVCDTLGLESLPREKFICEMQLGYLAESLPGDTLALYTAMENPWGFVQGIGAKSGQPCFEARIGFAQTER